MQAVTDFSFFAADDTVLFHRSDAESARWSVHEMTLKAIFPYVEGRAIERGMRIGFYDFDNVFEAFEVRNVRTLEPDHYQEITAEHICISELTDRHLFLYHPGAEVAAAVAIDAVMRGSGWSCLSTEASVQMAEPDITMTSVWSALCTLRDMYGMRIEPVVTVDDTGITGRGLRFRSLDGQWRGVRLSLNKNATQIGVTYDDTNLITAIYGYGESTAQANEPPAYLTFESVTWWATETHPAKPAGQAYLVDPEATARYGRNGTPRFGFYSNTAVSDPEKLLELSWEVLKNSNHPTVSIDLRVADLERLGYTGQDIRLGDRVMIDVEPTGELITDVVNTLEVDLLNPLETRPGVGAFVPDIVYIDKAQSDGTTASIGGGGGGGRKSQQKGDVWTTFERKNEYIDMTANRVTRLDNITTTQSTQIDLTSERILMIASETEWDTIKNTGHRLYSQIEQNARSIRLKVSKGDVATQLAVEAGNVSISGGNLVVDGYVTASQLSTTNARITNILNGTTVADTLKATNANLGGNGSGNVYLYGQRVRVYAVTDNNGTTRQVFGYTL